MPGSTKLEREVYEQYIIREAGGVDVLINKVNPMGGRMDKYFEMIDGVIENSGYPDRNKLILFYGYERH